MKRLALVVEGEADYGAIPVLLQNAGVEGISVIKFGGQAVDCDIPTLVDRCLVICTWIAVQKKPDKVIVVLDREYRPDCPGVFALETRDELVGQLHSRFEYKGRPPVSVVIADRMLENWLIADPAGVAGHAHIASNFSTKVSNNADTKAAEAIIKAAYRRDRTYHKRRDAPALAARVRTGEAAVRGRSKSLDKLLREAGA